MFALFFGTRALLKVLRIVYGLIWGVTPSKPQSTTKAMLAMLGLTTVAFIFIGLIDDLRDRSFLLSLIGIFVFSLVPFFAGLVASVYLPRQPTRWPDLIPGALFLALGVLVLHVVTVYWIAHEVESKTDTYGAIGAALALLLWSYLLGRLITASAVINASLWQQRQERAERSAARVSHARSVPRSGRWRGLHSPRSTQLHAEHHSAPGGYRWSSRAKDLSPPLRQRLRSP